MRLRWFRSAFWTLLVCLMATMLLAIQGFGLPYIVAAESQGEPEVVRWPSPQGLPMQPPAIDDEYRTRTVELEDRVKRLEAAITRLDATDARLTKTDEQLLRTAGELARADAVLTKRVADHEARPHAAPTGNLAATLQGQSRQLAAIENRLLQLREDFEAHVVAGSTPGPVEAKNTFVFFSLPVPIAIPTAAEPPRPAPVEEELDLDVEIPYSNAGRTETVTVHRTASTRPAARPVCDPCAIGPCPHCGRYHFSSATPPWTRSW